MGNEPILGVVTGFAGNFAPRGWAYCDGQLLPISSNDALFSLLGTIYGGDGRSTFGLPDLRGRAPIHAGQGPGLRNRPLGSKGGVESVTLTVNQLPPHNHDFMASSASPTSSDPNLHAVGNAPVFTSGRPGIAMGNSMVTHTGGSQSHSNMNPFLCVNWIIALVGTYPSRT